MADLPPPTPDCASCAARDVVIAEQGAALDELRADVVALAAEVRDLRRKLGRNSGNSSMAPSADDLPGREPPAPGPKRGGAGRKPGGQPGSKGSHLQWRAPPAATEPHPPPPGCACGAAPPPAPGPGVAAPPQVLAIPPAPPARAPP